MCGGAGRFSHPEPCSASASRKNKEILWFVYPAPGVSGLSCGEAENLRGEILFQALRKESEGCELEIRNLMLQ